MVYDRKLKGPAQLKKNGSFAEKLTKEEAEHVKLVLTDDLTVQSGQLPRRRRHEEIRVHASQSLQ